MKAVDSQIPEKEVKTEGQSTKPNKAKDAQWSMIRRLADRVQSLELAASTARRDINRIDRKQYRGKEDIPPSKDNNPPDNGGGESNPALYG